MKKNHTRFFGTLAALTLVAPICTFAADQVEAASDLAEIAAMSVEAKANLSDAALGGEVDAIAEAGKRSDAVDAAMAQAQEAAAAMERALAGGDEDAAQSAADDLKASKQKAMDALGGVIPESMMEQVADWRASKTNTGGGPSSAYDPPNIYNQPWQTDTIQNFYAKQFGSFFASGRGTGDKDATPE